MRLKLRLGTGMKSLLLLSTGLRKHGQVQEQEKQSTNNIPRGGKEELGGIITPLC